MQTTNQNITYGDLTALNPDVFPVDSQRPVTDVYVLSTPVNTPGGPLKGFEVSYQQTFKFLPGLLSNVGTQLNYTHVESEIDYCVTSACTSFVTADLVNLSPNAWNATLYYDDGKFNARVSAAYRDTYFQSVPGSNGATGLIPYQGKTETTTIDASASYNLTDKLYFRGRSEPDGRSQPSEPRRHRRVARQHLCLSSHRTSGLCRRALSLLIAS